MFNDSVGRAFLFYILNYEFDNVTSTYFPCQKKTYILTMY